MMRTMLIGRERERDVPRDRLVAAQQAQGGIVLISGEAGIGKVRDDDGSQRRARVRDG